MVEMNITEVRVKIVDLPNQPLRAKATFTIDDCFVVHDAKIMDGKGGLFICMPCKRLGTGERVDIVHALNNETREIISKALFSAYEKALAESKNEIAE